MRRALPPLAVLLLATLVLLLQLTVLRPWNPAADEVEYLTAGRNLATTGSFLGRPPEAADQPGREPLYSALIALVMRLDPGLDANAERCIGRQGDASCPPIYRSLAWANVLLGALTALFAFASVRLLAGGRLASLAAGVYVALNFHVMKELNHVESDYLAMALAGALAFCLALAWRRPAALGRWLAAGAVLGLLALTKASFLVYAVLLGVGGLVRLMWRRDRLAVGCVVASLVAGLCIGGWVVRNQVMFGRLAFTDGRGGIALSTREMLDHMTGPEYAASFLWWTRGFGGGLAKRLFAEKDWHRHEWYVPDGFYLQGQVDRYEARVSRLMQQRGLARPAAEAAVPGVVLGEIAADLPRYGATLLPVFYRGLWFDEFVVLGFPAFLWLSWQAIRRGRGGWLLAASPTLFCLLFYPAASLNVPRYQLPALTGFAVAGGLAVAALVAWWRRRIINTKPPAAGGLHQGHQAGDRG